jgi:hypothetical protein
MRNFILGVFLVFFTACEFSDVTVDGYRGNIGRDYIECVLVKAGNFKTSGGTTVTLTEDFYIGKYPVTQAQYRAVMGSNPSKFRGDNKPVEMVTWQNAVNFCKAVGGFLPTEAQWQFAARGGNNSNGYTYSGSNNLGEVGWYYDNSGYETHPVGQKKPNELGIYDMSGNVWEWTADWYQYDYPSSSMNPTGANSGNYRVIRGGSWRNYEGNCRVFYRHNGYPDDSNNYRGFRVAFPSRGDDNPVNKPQKSDKIQGIMFEKNIVSDKAVMRVQLPNKEDISLMKLVIYDNICNVVFEKTQNDANVTWGLTNSAGRVVANGSYLIVAEIKGMSGKTYIYSAKLGAKR